ncbi:phosphotransferase [Microbacterium sp.]|uniref:phosphotransferase n=1 Tax=Microbacterium sp. TaxID=51671 RepID=UPI002604EEB7|nr:phosphotransferase [Microbacterium sp.]
MSGWERLSAAQRAWVQERLADAHVVTDMSWNVVESIVLRVRSGDEDVVVKAGGRNNHHIGRELSAHPEYTRSLVESALAAPLRDSDASLRVMILDFLAGELVQGTDAETHTPTYMQAGALLRALHQQETRTDADYWPRTIARALAWFDQPHRVEPETEQKTRDVLRSAAAKPVAVVPTHGDWQPRNWLIDGETVRVIDFGRFAFRPAATDFTRLAAQQWRGRPDLEAAFFDGYGDDPRDRDDWRLERLQEAVGTACWAFQVGDEQFEAQGHRMLAEVLAEY